MPFTLTNLITPYIQSAGNPILFKFKYDEYKIGDLFYCEVYAAASKDMRVPAPVNLNRILLQTLQKNGPGDGSVEFDISSVLSSYFQDNAINKPELTYTFQADTTPYVPFYINVGIISYDNTNKQIKLQKFAQDEAVYAMQAALPYKVSNVLNTLEPYCERYGSSPLVKFLTNMPNKVYCKRNQDLPLAVIFPLLFSDVLRSLIVKADLYFQDGTIERAYQLATQNFTTGAIYRANVKPNAIGSHSKYTQLTKYVVWFEMKDLDTNVTNIISETQTIVVKEGDGDESATIVFKNTLGGWDAIEFSNTTDSEFKIKSNSFISSYANRTYKVESSDTLTYISRWLTLDEYRWLRNELLVSPAIYINGDYYRMEDATFKDSQVDNLFQIQLSVNPEYEQNSISL
jgi:hypothetical protein